MQALFIEISFLPDVGTCPLTLSLIYSLSLSLSLSLIFFLTILDNLAMIIIDQNSIHFSSLHLFGLVRSTSIQFGLLRFTLVQLGPFSPFIPIQSIWFTSVYFNLLRSIWSCSVQFNPFGPFGLLQSIASTLVHSVNLTYFKSLLSNLVYLLKNEKIQVSVETTINYLRSTNCNYMISFDYHNNLFKRMRI